MDVRFNDNGLGRGQIIQLVTMPEASALYNNVIVQFVGTTTSDYKNGCYYKCKHRDSSYYWDIHDTTTKIKNRKIICIGDSYNLNLVNDGKWKSWGQCLADNNPQYTVYTDATGGAGFVNATEGRNFLQTLNHLLNTVTIYSEDITDIVVLGGYNDIGKLSTEAGTTSVKTAIKTFVDYCRDQFPFARILISAIGFDYNSAANNYKCYQIDSLYKEGANLAGASHFEHFKFILWQKSLIYFANGDANSGFHPNTNGNNEVANYLRQYLENGYFDVRKGIAQQNAFVYFDNGNIRISPQPGSSNPSEFLTDALSSATLPFNTWVKICDCGNSSGDNLLWGAQESVGAYWSGISYSAGSAVNMNSIILFKLVDKAIYANNTGNTNTLTSPNVLFMGNLSFDKQLVF